MSLSQLYRSNRPVLSFELYPPKTPQGEAALYEHVEQLCGFRPDFVTCTYGAGGTSRDKTLQIVCQVKKRFGVPVASHLTVVGSTVDQLRRYLQQAARAEVDFIVALRGDPPAQGGPFRPAPGGLRHANELVRLIRDEFACFGIAVAGYPETHQEAVSPEADLQYLKQKVDAGADVVITQLFYDNADYFRFRDRCAAVGIAAPIVPGLLPITNLKQVQRITSLCGARLPQRLVQQLESCADDESQLEVGVQHAIGQVRQLVQGGAPGLHFYVLNQSRAAMRILSQTAAQLGHTAP